ncbi:hypothetical protein PoB_003027200 [Plakobranchus ocellatus]|uniref:Uncharacterized protein n=1 Tax=Plakobranchus ocellatus TaxID=259542 RepID=A0AAV4A9Z7_9GAST|nr:hypothetical protein PoB_003027200 [Plakobranchus ocellatus]
MKSSVVLYHYDGWPLQGKCLLSCVPAVQTPSGGVIFDVNHVQHSLLVSWVAHSPAKRQSMGVILGLYGSCSRTFRKPISIRALVDLEVSQLALNYARTFLSRVQIRYQRLVRRCPKRLT